MRLFKKLLKKEYHGYAFSNEADAVQFMDLIPQMKSRKRVQIGYSGWFVVEFMASPFQFKNLEENLHECGFINKIEAVVERRL